MRRVMVMNPDETRGCYCYWSWFAKVVVHVFLDRADTCTCERRRLRRG